MDLTALGDLWQFGKGTQGTSDGDSGEGFVCCCSQTLELPPTRDQTGHIFAVVSQAELQMRDWVSGCEKDMIIFYTYFKSLTHFNKWPSSGAQH